MRCPGNGPIAVRASRFASLACLALVSGLALACGGDRAPGTGDVPNIVFVVIDTARADHFSCYGYAKPTTPNVDALATDAVLYRQARSAAPWTLPSHASMFTGLWPSDHGLHFSAQGLPDQYSTMVTKLRESSRRRLLAARLAERGYATFGVSNNIWVSEYTGLDHGFEQFFSAPPNRDGLEALRRRLESDTLPTTAAAGSVELFRRSLETGEISRPFFAFINLMEAHFPYLPDQTHAGRFGGNREALAKLVQSNSKLELAMVGGSAQPDPSLLTPLYDEELASVDTALGSLFTLLRERGIYDETLIVVTSDHGEHLGEDSRYSHQLSMADTLLDVPLLIKYPREARITGIVDEPLISTVDIYQTLLAAAWPEDPPPSEVSKDLARMDQFDRRWSVAEYHYSPTYLARVKAAAEDFDAAPHRVLRRVFLTPQGRWETSSEHPSSPSAPLPAALRDEISAYLTRVNALEDREGGGFSSDALDQLRTLGYLD